MRGWLNKLSNTAFVLFGFFVFVSTIAACNVAAIVARIAGNPRLWWFINSPTGVCVVLILALALMLMVRRDT